MVQENYDSSMKDVKYGMNIRDLGLRWMTQYSNEAAIPPSNESINVTISQIKILMGFLKGNLKC